MQGGAKRILMMLISLIVAGALLYISLFNLVIPSNLNMNDGLPDKIDTSHYEDFETYFFDEYVRTLKECYASDISPPCICNEYDGSGLLDNGLLLVFEENPDPVTKAYLFESGVSPTDIDETNIEASKPIKAETLNIRNSGLAEYADYEWKPKSSKYVFLKGSLTGNLVYYSGNSLSAMSSVELPRFELIRTTSRHSSFEPTLANLNPSDANSGIIYLHKCSDVLLGDRVFNEIWEAMLKANNSNSNVPINMQTLPDSMYFDYGSGSPNYPKILIENVPGQGVYLHALNFPEQNWAGQSNRYTLKYTRHLPGARLRVVAHQDEPISLGHPCNSKPAWRRPRLWTDNFEWSDSANTFCLYSEQETGKTDINHESYQVDYYKRNIVVIESLLDGFHLGFREDEYKPLGDDQPSFGMQASGPGAFAAREEIGRTLRFLDDSAYDTSHSQLVLELYP